MTLYHIKKGRCASHQRPTANVWNGSSATDWQCPSHVRFTPESDQSTDPASWPSCPRRLAKSASFGVQDGM